MTNTGQTYKTTRLIRFAGGDQAGVLFFARIFPLAHEVMEDFIVHCGIGWHHWFDSDRIGVPFRKVDADYQRPLRPGDHVEAELTVSRLGNSSITFRIDFSKEGQQAATVTMTCVCVDRQNLRPLAIPPERRDALRPYLAG